MILSSSLLVFIAQSLVLSVSYSLFVYQITLFQSVHANFPNILRRYDALIGRCDHEPFFVGSSVDLTLKQVCVIQPCECANVSPCTPRKRSKDIADSPCFEFCFHPISLINVSRSVILFRLISKRINERYQFCECWEV